MPHLSRIRIRWWHLVLVFIALIPVVILGIGALYRQRGYDRYVALLAQRRAAGHPTTIEDLRARIPPVDEELQEAWWAWTKTIREELAPDQAGQMACDQWLIAGGEPPTAMVARVANLHAVFQPAVELLRHGGLQLGALGWVATDAPIGRRDLTSIAEARGTHLLAERALAQWLRYAAALADEPDPFLADLDALREAHAHPGTLVDAMVGLALGGIRDRAYVDCALRGTLDPARAEAWCREPGEALRRVGDGYEGEAILTGGAVVTVLAEGGPGGTRLDQLDTFCMVRFGCARPLIWATGFGDGVIITEAEFQVADRLRALRSDPPPDRDTLKSRLWILGRRALPNLSECGMTAVFAEAQHRQARLAVRVLTLARGGELPDDQPALLAILGEPALLATAGDDLRLCYEKLGPDRFLLAIDPATPVPNIVDPVRVSSAVHGMGAPPAVAPIVWERWKLEIQVPKSP